MIETMTEAERLEIISKGPELINGVIHDLSKASGKCCLMESDRFIPALEDWTLSTEWEISGVKIVYMVPIELVEQAERLGAVKILKDE